MDTLDITTRRMIVAVNDTRLDLTRTQANDQLTELSETAEELGFTALVKRIDNVRVEFAIGRLPLDGVVQDLRVIAANLMTGSNQ